MFLACRVVPRFQVMSRVQLPGSTVPETSHALTIVLIASEPTGRGPKWLIGRAQPAPPPRHATNRTALHAHKLVDVDSRRDHCHSRSIRHVRTAERSHVAACTQPAHSLSSRHAHLRYRLLDARWPAAKSPIAHATRVVDTCTQVGASPDANSRSDADSSAVEQPERRRPEHESRHCSALNKCLTLRAAHGSTKRDEKASRALFSVRVRCASREQAPKMCVHAVSAISA